MHIRTPEDNPELFELYEQLVGAFANRNFEVDRASKFHMTVARKLSFRSAEAKSDFLARGEAAVEAWRQKYPDGALLTPDERKVTLGHVSQEEVDNPGGVYLFLGRNNVRRYFPPTP